MRINIISFLTISLLLFSIGSPLTAYAETDNETASYSTKDEVIYGKLYPNGQINEMYVVNSFYETIEGKIIDYGAYENIRNLTDLSTIEQVDDQVTFDTTGEDFYYQGKLNGDELPWDIHISYYLDGVKTDADELAGESGQLDIHIETKQNQTIDPLFFDYYLLQISLTLDPLHFQQITAPKGTEANEGKNKMINFSGMPGEEDVFIMNANVENLTMDPISISAIPANLGFDDPDTSDMEDDMKQLSDAIRDLHDGVEDLYSGVADLDDGTGELNNGSTDFLKGMKTLNSSSEELVSGSQIIKDAFAEIDAALDVDLNIDIPNAADLKQLPDILRAMSDELNDFSKILKSIEDSFANLPEDNLGLADIKKLLDRVREDYGKDDPVYKIVKQLAESYGETAEVLLLIQENMPDELDKGAQEMAAYLDEIANELEENLSMLDELDQITELIEGLQTMAREYNQFHDGLVEYTNGVSELTNAYIDIDHGIHELSSGTSTLKSGVKELVDGTKELHEETKYLPDDMQLEIEKFMDDFDFSDYEAQSFVSDKNTNIGVVQFVLQTETIDLPEDDDDEDVVEEKKGLWQRFLDLFR